LITEHISRKLIHVSGLIVVLFSLLSCNSMLQKFVVNCTCFVEVTGNIELKKKSAENPCTPLITGDMNVIRFY
jgi:hypothetical protein